MTAILPRLRAQARVLRASTPDGVVFTLEAPGAQSKRFTERVWKALVLLDSVDTFEAWHAAVGDPKITVERLRALVGSLEAAGLLQARANDDLERTSLHAIPGASFHEKPAFEFFSDEGAPVAAPPSAMEHAHPEASVPAPATDQLPPPDAFEMRVDGAASSEVTAVLNEAGPRRVRLLRLGRRTAAAVVVAAVLGVLGVAVKLPLVLTYEFELSPADSRGVRPVEAGILKTLLVEEGKVVKAGDVVARLEGSERETTLSKIEAQLARAQAALSLHVRGARPEELEKGKAAVTGLSRELAIAQARVSRTKQLISQGLAPQTDVEAARAAAAALSGQLAQANAELALLRSGPRAEEVAMLQSEVVSLEAQRRAASESVAALTLTAPIDGVVITPRLKAHLGSRVEAGDQLMEIADVTSRSAT